MFPWKRLFVPRHLVMALESRRAVADVVVVEEEFKADDTNNGLLNSSGLVCDSRDKRRCLWTQILAVEETSYNKNCFPQIFYDFLNVKFSRPYSESPVRMRVHNMRRVCCLEWSW